MNKIFLSLIVVFVFVFTSCFARGNGSAGENMKSFKSVSMSEGLNLMKNDKDFVLLDVRTPEEFADGHIPGAVQLTNETFTKQDAENLIADKNQTVYVYCRSGRRSKNSSQKLVNFGYTNVIEIGGIASYSGPIEK